MKSSKIKKVRAREILDSRGEPTIEVELHTDSGIYVSQVPSGASVGKHEAKELRDGGKRYFGKGVLKAVGNVNDVIAPKIKGIDSCSQKKIDDLLVELDGTEDKSGLGANALCGVSLAVCRAGAGSRKMELFKYINKIAKTDYKLKIGKPRLPDPLFNIINGGVHAGSNLDFQEFLAVIKADSFSKKMQIISEVFHQLKTLLRKRFGKLATNIGDEGGFTPPLRDPARALDFIFRAAQDLGYKTKVSIILDVAASQFFREGRYETGMGLFTRQGLMRYYAGLVQNYPVLGLEDPFAEDDWQGFRDITRELGKRMMIIGDDLLVTSPKRMRIAEEKKAVNAMILKINQIGTVSEAFGSARLAGEFGWKIVVSHRSGETNDDFIADFAAGVCADFMKGGAPTREERIAKYNRLLKIEREL